MGIKGTKTWEDAQTFQGAAGTVAAGSYSAAGAWTLGPASSPTTTHTVNGILDVGNTQTTTPTGGGVYLYKNSTLNGTFSAFSLNFETGSAGSRTSKGGVDSAGTWTLGPATGAATHTFQSGSITRVNINSGGTDSARLHINAGGGSGVSFLSFDRAGTRIWETGFDSAGPGGANGLYWYTTVYMGGISSSGAWTLGPATPSGGLLHTINGNTLRLTSGSSTTLDEVGYQILNNRTVTDDGGANINRASAILRSNAGNTGLILQSVNSATPKAQVGPTGASTIMEFVRSASIVIGGYDTTGAWTLGPSTSTLNHTIRAGAVSLHVHGVTSNSSVLVKSTAGTGAGIQFQDSLAIGDTGTVGHITTVNRLQARCGASGGAELLNGATTWTAISDIRYKKDIIELNYGLNEILSLETVKYRLLEDTSDRKYRLGFKAQQVLPHLPELVDESLDMDGSTKLFLNVHDMTPVLVKAIQELKALNDTQAAALAAAEARITALET